MTEQKITKLTEEQEARLGEYRDKWLEIGRSTDPTDKEKAEKHMREAYEVVEFKPPRIVWFDSPYSGSLFTRIAELYDVLKEDGREDDAKKLINIEKYINDPSLLTKALVKSMESKLSEIGADDAWKKACSNEQNNRMYGMFDAEWLSVYNYFLEVCNLDCCEKLVPLMHVAEQVGWWWPWEEMIIATNKPTALQLDEGNRLHCASGPALEYLDGEAVFALHGIEIDRRIVENPETITVSEIEKEQNVEIRRILLERYGLDRYRTDAGMLELDSDEKYGILYQKEYASGVPYLCVLVTNHTAEPDGSFKKVTLGLPHDANITTAKEAVAWTWEEEPENFDLVIRS